VFVINSARKLAGDGIAMLSAMTPESAAALRERMGLVKRRMGELELEGEAKRGRSDSGPSQRGGQ